MPEDAYAEAATIQRELRALHSSLHDLSRNMPEGSPRNRVVDHCEVIRELDGKMESLMQTIRWEEIKPELREKGI